MKTRDNQTKIKVKTSRERGGGGETDRHRQAGRQTDRQTDGQGQAETDRETEKIWTVRNRQINTDRQAERERQRQRQIETERQTDSQRQRRLNAFIPITPQMCLVRVCYSKAKRPEWAMKIRFRHV